MSSQKSSPPKVGLSLYAFNGDFPSSGIHSSLKISMELTDTVITHTGDYGPYMYFQYIQDPNIDYEKVRSDSDHFIITKFDPANKIISGTFNITMHAFGRPNDTLQITDGRFDLKIDTTYQRVCTN